MANVSLLDDNQKTWEKNVHKFYSIPLNREIEMDKILLASHVRDDMSSWGVFNGLKHSKLTTFV